ncbi:MAG TPA: hypothetical protein VJX67_09650 [Blastocatellia bacterium]|nr:hypothetical protein [Blastocatellia bacterium]
MTDLGELIGTLTGHRVQFIVVGGAAATDHGSARLTQHLDLVYVRNESRGYPLILGG